MSENAVTKAANAVQLDAVPLDASSPNEALSDAGVPSTALIDTLVTQPQVRQTFETESIEELAASIREVGILQPILVRRNDAGRLVVLDGERRLRAAKRAGFRTVPVRVHEGPLDEGDIIKRQLIANLHSVELNDDEKAVALEQLMKALNCTAAQVAARVGVSASTVSRLLRLLTAPPELRLAVRTGRVPASSVCEVTKEKDRKRREAMTTLLLNGELTKQDLFNLRKSAAAKSAADPIDSTSRHTFHVDGTTVTVVARGSTTAQSLRHVLDVLQARLRRAIAERMSLPTLCKLMKEQANAPTCSATSAPIPTHAT